MGGIFAFLAVIDILRSCTKSLFSPYSPESYSDSFDCISFLLTIGSVVHRWNPTDTCFLRPLPSISLPSPDQYLIRSYRVYRGVKRSTCSWVAKLETIRCTLLFLGTVT